jgi:D-alanyl-lipoteichoic acid acyltransferase DltB (MBOAT superfamily)
MTFTSFMFFGFLVAVFLADQVLPKAWRNPLLLAASYVFYGLWDTRFLFLLILSSVLFYSGGLIIHRGGMTARERLTASAWVIVAALVLLGLRWDAFRPDGAGSLLPTSAWPLLATLVFVAAVNLVYPRFTLLQAERRKRLGALLSIGGNLGILGVFKYFNFFLDNLAYLLQGLGLEPTRWHLEIALPVGISFYTFQGMTYAVDIYRGRLEPTTRFPDFALFHSFFPLILSGPIERASRLLPQFLSERRLQVDQVRRGVGLIVLGLFKKVVIADGIAGTATAVFGATGRVSSIDACVGAVAFAVQLYCDFSGYSDVAVGTASFFGIELTTNFRHPYFSRNAAEFWSRWHISLSTWFRDYVFYPLGGPRGTTARWMRNVLVTFLVTGLWHGAAWHYVLWGLYHGVLLCGYRLWESRHPRPVVAPSAFARAWSILLFFGLTCYGWILFRSQSLSQVANLSASLWPRAGGLHLTAPIPPVSTLFGLPVLLLVELVGHLSGGKPIEKAMPMPAWTAIYALLVFGLVLGAGSVSTQFMYFDF